jgi:hypothetical protein
MVPAMAAIVCTLDADTEDRLGAVIRRLSTWNLPTAWIADGDHRLEVVRLTAGGRAPAEQAARDVADVAWGASLRGLRLAGLGGLGGRDRTDAAWGAPALLRVGIQDPDGCLEDLRLDLADALEGRITGEPPGIALARPLPGDAIATPGLWPDLLAELGDADWGPCGISALRVELHGGEVIAEWRC